MIKFINKKTLIIRSLVLVLILSMLGYSGYLFFTLKDVVLNFKPYYIRSYASAINYSAKNIIDKERADVKQESASSVPVLLYHGLVDQPDGSNVTLKNFSEQMRLLKEAGYQTVAYDDFCQFMNGKKTLPDKSFLLTFDDGRRDSYYPADPILNALDYSAIMFALGGRTDSGEFYLSSKELVKAEESKRWEIQSHGYNDHDLIQIDSTGAKGPFLSNRAWISSQNKYETEQEYEQRVDQDFDDSKDFFKTLLKKEITAFAYPYGDYAQYQDETPPYLQPIVAEMINNNFKYSFYQVISVNGSSFNIPGDENMIKRIRVMPTWSSSDLINILNRGKAKKLSYLDDFTADKGWVKTWGEQELGNNILKVKSNDTTGGETFLNGSDMWKNILVHTEIEVNRGSNAILLLRYKDNKNFVSLNVSNNNTRVEQTINGINYVLNQEKNSFENYQNLDISASAVGNQFKAVVNGQSFDCQLREETGGGIGLRSWDKEFNNSEIFVKKIEARQAND